MSRCRPHDATIAGIQDNTKISQEELRDNKTIIENSINDRINSKPELERNISANREDINIKQRALRILAQKNQIYRFAQKWAGHDDILDVSEKELTIIASIWFGSIALISATVGTALPKATPPG